MKKIRKIQLAFLLIGLLTLGSCQEILEDCIFWPSRPEIETETIESGVINQPFFRTIRCGVENSPGDDNYNYDIQLRGELPPGVGYSVSGREITISGTPTEYGTFSINVLVEITIYNSEYGEYDGENFCFGNNTESKDYTFNIESF